MTNTFISGNGPGRRAWAVITVAFFGFSALAGITMLAPTKAVALSAVASTAMGADPGGKYETRRLGLGGDADGFAGVADAYVKTNPRLAGRWGWMPMLRVGGGAGDFNTALLSFALGDNAIPAWSALTGIWCRA